MLPHRLCSHLYVRHSTKRIDCMCKVEAFNPLREFLADPTPSVSIKLQSVSAENIPMDDQNEVCNIGPFLPPCACLTFIPTLQIRGSRLRHLTTHFCLDNVCGPSRRVQFLPSLPIEPADDGNTYRLPLS